MIQQLGGNPGNISIIWDGVIHKHDPAIGYGEGWGLLMRRLDVTQLLGSGGTGSPGSAPACSPCGWWRPSWRPGGASATSRR